LYQPFRLLLEQSLLSSLRMHSLTHVNLKKGMTSVVPQFCDEEFLAVLSKEVVKKEEKLDWKKTKT